MEIFCGIDWSESHHDVAVIDASGGLVARSRISDDVAGFTALSVLLAETTGEEGFTAVDVAIETDRGLLVAALRAAGHRVVAINPKAVDRYRDRHAVSGAKSDPGDALVLADILRTDRHVHRVLPANTDQAEALGVLARTHQDLSWVRQRDTNRLRSMLREFFPAALGAFPDLTIRTALVVLEAAPTPTAARKLSSRKLIALLRAAGRGTLPAQADRLRAIFTADQLHQPAGVEDAMGHAVRAIVSTLAATNAAIRDLERSIAATGDAHPDAQILDSLPGLGPILRARMLGEFGDDPNRFANAAARRNYAGTSPVTRSSGKWRVVHLRHSGNKRLSDACRQWAFTAMAHSPGARAHYDRRRAAGDGHEAALRNLGNKLVGQLDHCLRNRAHYDEQHAWASHSQLAA